MILHWCMKCGKAYDDYTYCPECDTPPAPERREPCKWIDFTGRCSNLDVRGVDCSNPDACGHYESKVQEHVSGHKHDMIVYDDIKIGPLNKEFREAIEKFTKDIDPSPRHYRCGVSIGGGPFDEWLLTIEPNKEDNDMSGNAYFCDSCRGTFPKEEVHVMYMNFERADRNACVFERAKAEKTFICDKCYAKFRKATAPFNFPWNEWRKGDDDE